MKLERKKFQRIVNRVWKQIEKLHLTDWVVTVELRTADKMDQSDSGMEVCYNRRHGYAEIWVNESLWLADEFKDFDHMLRKLIRQLLHETFHVRMEPYLMQSGVTEDSRCYITERASTGVDILVNHFCDLLIKSKTLQQSW